MALSGRPCVTTLEVERRVLAADVGRRRGIGRWRVYLSGRPAISDRLHTPCSENCRSTASLFMISSLADSAVLKILGGGVVSSWLILSMRRPRLHCDIQNRNLEVV